MKAYKLHHLRPSLTLLLIGIRPIVERAIATRTALLWEPNCGEFYCGEETLLRRTLLRRPVLWEVLLRKALIVHVHRAISSIR